VIRRGHVVRLSGFAALEAAIVAGVLPADTPTCSNVVVWSQYRDVNASGAVIFYDHEDRANPLSFVDVLTLARGEWLSFVPIDRTPAGLPMFGIAPVEDALRRAGKKHR
jgi:hypothetical protein